MLFRSKRSIIIEKRHEFFVSDYKGATVFRFRDLLCLDGFETRSAEETLLCALSLASRGDRTACTVNVKGDRIGAICDGSMAKTSDTVRLLKRVDFRFRSEEHTSELQSH